MPLLEGEPMPAIVLTAEQARILAESLQPVEVRDPDGNLLAIIPALWTEEDLREVDRRWQETQFSDCCTTAELMARLQTLEQP
jgi:hypothetical protein